MRGFREIGNPERRLEGMERRSKFANCPLALQAEEGYKRIKPETNITAEEAQSFWDSYFDQPITEKDD